MVDRPDDRSRLLRDLLVVALGAAVARVVGALVIRALGFSVVSDDDFARVVLAQKQAATPHLDPTGTSWLPLPFWVVGAGLRVFGASLAAARALSFVAGPLFGALLGAFAVALGMRRSRALAASAAAAAMPWSMQLGVATVPEVPAAICAAMGCLALASSNPRARLLGGAALLVSTLSRYDAWVVAVAFALLTTLDALRGPRASRVALLAAAALALLGPVGWTLYQWRAFGQPFRYLGLVRSYRRALGQGPPLRARLLGYPLGVVEEMREVLGALLVGGVSTRSGTRDLAWGRPLALAALQLVVLVAGDVRDGAPTHHPERALLGPALVVVFFAADALGGALAVVSPKRALGFGAAAALAYAGWVGVRLHRSLRWYDAAPRAREVAAGAALANAVPVGTKVLLDTRDFPGGGLDYGYYAVLAALGRPLDATVDRDQDPRKPRRASAFATEAALRLRCAETGARAALVWGDTRAGVAVSTGARVVAREGDAEGWVVVAWP